jgi:AraC family transcriptional regulator, regulatory protein of adaptative response / DNA-3-methyladenine glycosylase II
MITAELAVRPPFDWATMIRYLAPRSTPGVESVSGDTYQRTLRVDGTSGYVVLTAPRGGAVVVRLSPSLAAHRESVLAKLRLLVDAEAPIRRIGRALSADPTMAALVRRRPGLRVAGAVDAFELALRAVLGQQISVRAASTFSGRLVARFGEPIAGAPTGLTHLSVPADRLADARVTQVFALGLTRARSETVVALARAAVAGQIADPTQLRAISGIGDWTAQYVAMRAFRDPDAFPYADIGLRKAAGGLTASALRQRAEQWRPWRSYAAMHLWASLSDH